MRIKISQSGLEGSTLFEVAVVIAIVLVLGAVWLTRTAEEQGPSRITCVNNLKQLGTAYRIWENDNGDVYPMQQTEALGGMQGLLSNSASAGPFAYLPYYIMQNELGQSPRIVLCPADDRSPNENFYVRMSDAPTEPGFKLLATTYGTFNNTNVSYFCGVGAIDTQPRSILGGDRNLGNGPQDPFYGISGTNASTGYPCGADAVINTHGKWSSASVSGGGGSVKLSQPVAWSAKMHSAGNKWGLGNLMLGDGSVQQCTSAGLRDTWIKAAFNLGNFAASDTNHTAAAGDIRLLFP